MHEDATPPLCPAPMPRQELAFWTPGTVLMASLRVLIELRRPQRLLRRATIRVTNADETR